MYINNKQPERRCIGCYKSFNKKELIRIVRDKDGNFSVDLTGKKSGRGAYICKDTACLENAFKKKQLERSYAQKISKEIYENLRLELEENVR